jgi:hypothetical protein
MIWISPRLGPPSGCMIRELRGGDVEAYVELRREALLDSPLALALVAWRRRSSDLLAA